MVNTEHDPAQGFAMSRDEIRAVIGLSPQRIQQLEMRAVRRLWREHGIAQESD
jgi:hypothetical protein